MEKRILVPVAQGTEEMEAITIIDVLRRAGAKVVVASVDKMTIKAAQGIEFKADILIKECLDESFDLIAYMKPRKYVRANDCPFINKQLRKAIMTRSRLKNK